MKEIDIENWNRKNTYNWFKTFSNSTYGVNVKLNVTSLVKLSKLRKESFFTNMLFIVMKSLNSIDAMRMRYENGVPIIYDEINPSFTVMTESGTFDNARFKNISDYKEFYNKTRSVINEISKQTTLKESDYNPSMTHDEYYITCVPWLNFESSTHPIPDDKDSQCVPRIGWGKYVINNDKYEMTMNITVSHIFVDGKHISDAFNKIQELLDTCEEILK